MNRTPARITLLLAATALSSMSCASGATSKPNGNTSNGACTGPTTAIAAIQGSGAASPMIGQVVTTTGVVIGDYEGDAPTLRGFYIQDPAGDRNAETSDGIFIFNPGKDVVKLGDRIRVTGKVEEFQDQTQIGSVSDIVHCSSGASIAPTDVRLPMTSPTSFEKYEGMLVRLPQNLFVTDNYQIGRFGEVMVSANARLMQPTSVVAPGNAANAMAQQNILNTLILDDALNAQNPDTIVLARGGQPLSAANTLRNGDAISGVIGVMTYSWGGNAASPNAFRVRPINAMRGGAPAFVAANPRLSSPPPVGGTLRVGAMNLLNYYNTFTGCTYGVNGPATNCRGANSAEEFARQWPKTVAAIVALDADVLTLMELENDGYGPSSAMVDLVTHVNAATAPGTYAFIDVDVATGTTNALGTDGIRVGMLYKPARVKPVAKTAVLSSREFVTGGDTTARNRVALAQAFEQPSGARVVISANHLKSKLPGCVVPDANDGQGPCNVVRKTAAQLLASWLATDPTGSGDPDVLIIGDLNSYAKEDPVTALRNAGYTNLIETRIGAGAYSFVFNGSSGYLDHALASPTLVPQVAGIVEWHINADEPGVLDYNTEFKKATQLQSLYRPDMFRMSDHDPILIGLKLTAAPRR